MMTGNPLQQLGYPQEQRKGLLSSVMLAFGIGAIACGVLALTPMSPNLLLRYWHSDSASLAYAAIVCFGGTLALAGAIGSGLLLIRDRRSIALLAAATNVLGVALFFIWLYWRGHLQY
jgi:hypothetical protein